MRLLHTRTLELSEFLENATPAYAILSHTWEKEEVSFKDMQGPNAKKKAGYAKVQKCCEQAARDGYEYVWIDTCCIDKSSSAELSEAINSMYVWYKNAKTCYAYLADLDTKGWFGWLSEAPESFKKSRWFTRGWTLQELIAPARLEFFDKYWSPFGTKADRHSVLSEITGIDELTLIGGRELREVSIAKRMSWASKRVTTRVEDIAYCLIGIFGVNLPLLYGEGERAFIRLQEEIMRSSDDQSLFAWGFTDQESKVLHEADEKILYVSDYEKKPEPQRSTLRGFLARSPAAFEKSGNVVPYRNWDVSMPYSMTNQGLRLELPVVQHEGFKEYTAILACHFQDNYLGPLGIYISPVASPNGDQFARDVWRTNPVLVVPQHALQARLRTIYIRQDVLLPTYRDFDRRDHFLIRTYPGIVQEDNLNPSYILRKVFPTESWSESQKIIRVDHSGLYQEAALIFSKEGVEPEKVFAVLLRSRVSEDGAYQCGCSIVVLSSVPNDEAWPKLFHMDGEARPSESTESHIDLPVNPESGVSKEREMAVVKIGREVFLGQAMFVVDIDVWSSRLKNAPFFAALVDGKSLKGDDNSLPNSDQLL
jgi:hypothetical protein